MKPTVHLLCVIVFAIISQIETSVLRKRPEFELSSCDVSSTLKNEIGTYASTVSQIMEYVLEGPYKGKTYQQLRRFLDLFGSRPAGSKALEVAIDYMIHLSKKESLRNVTTEDVNVPHWIRGDESVTMVAPRIKNIDMLGLGGSVSTSRNGISGEVLSVRNFDELEAFDDIDVQEKIVLFNPTYTTFNETVLYRINGASRAARKGAIACLVRSITPFSLNSPHTGLVRYEKGTKRIPVAEISVEDAGLLSRMSVFKNVIINMKMLYKYERKQSRNTIIDYNGRKYPEKFVIVSGHIDSWDVGQGAMDDGGGVFVSWAVPVILRRMGLRPKRTIRTVFWTAEELGLLGARAYETKHRNGYPNITFAMESDDGTFAPLGLKVKGTKRAICIVAEILKLFRSMNASQVIIEDELESDIKLMTNRGVPGATLHNDNRRYYWFHHSDGDTINVQNPGTLDRVAVFWTAVAYIVADLSEQLPRFEFE